MKRGHHIPEDLRPAMALRAIKLFEGQPSRKIGLLAVEDAFDVSSSTACNLVCAGRRLREERGLEFSGSGDH